MPSSIHFTRSARISATCSSPRFGQPLGTQAPGPLLLGPAMWARTSVLEVPYPIQDTPRKRTGGFLGIHTAIRAEEAKERKNPSVTPVTPARSLATSTSVPITASTAFHAWRGPQILHHVWDALVNLTSSPVD